ncbi:hypothetical protein IIE_05275 [Bacillus cereus VD045]|nr:hypothetical protein IIE_05275 [Bacillus cereus VD045]
MKNYKQVWKGFLFVSCIFGALMTGVCLIFSPWFKDTVMKTKTSQLNIEHFSVQEIKNYTKNGKFGRMINYLSVGRHTFLFQWEKLK